MGCELYRDIAALVVCYVNLALKNGITGPHIILPNNYFTDLTILPVRHNLIWRLHNKCFLHCCQHAALCRNIVSTATLLKKDNKAELIEECKSIDVIMKCKVTFADSSD